jgi:hypothetical protein
MYEYEFEPRTRREQAACIGGCLAMAVFLIAFWGVVGVVAWRLLHG